ncbi:MAG TPA: cold shock domain-containing protein [Pyrinomonadaceae bacterium]|nr:cold shock domain-containing protein [Pyrinomonadaceae bacterium]
MRRQGKIAKWNDERGFGFISSEGGDSVFVHISSLPRSDRRPSLNEAVSYTLAFDSHGRPQASDVRFIVRLSSDPPVRQIPRSGNAVRIAFAMSFLIALAVLATVGRLEMSLLALYSGASIITYGCYSRDKTAA